MGSLNHNSVGLLIILIRLKVDFIIHITKLRNRYYISNTYTKKDLIFFGGQRRSRVQVILDRGFERPQLVGPGTKVDRGLVIRGVV